MRKPLIASVSLHVLLLVVVLLDPSADGRRLDVDVHNSVEVVSVSDVPALASLGTPVAAPRTSGGRRETTPPPAAAQASRAIPTPTPPSAKPPAPGRTGTPGSGGPAATPRPGDPRAEPAPVEPSRPAREETAAATEPVPAPKPEPKAEPAPAPEPTPAEDAAARQASGGGMETTSSSTTSPPLIDFSEPKPPSPPADTPPADTPPADTPAARPAAPETPVPEAPAEQAPTPEEPADAEVPDFASVLQRVDDLEAAERAAATIDPALDPTRAPAPDQIAALLESAEPQLGQADQVTADEIAALRRQIEACWNVPAGARDAGDLIVRLRVVMNRDGTPSSVVIDDARQPSGSGAWQAAADSARRAVLNPRCHPFRLPPEKYETWKQLVLTFNPQEMMNR